MTVTCRTGKGVSGRLLACSSDNHGGAMSWEDRPDTTIYKVVVNHEEQYSIWQMGREIPAGWSREGFEGPREACLSHIEEVWTDMRPLSIRQRLDG